MFNYYWPEETPIIKNCGKDLFVTEGKSYTLSP